MTASLNDVLWGGLAFTNGLTIGTQIVAVDGTAYTSDRLKDAIENAKKSTEPIELLVRSGDRFRTVRFNYHDGLRYPHLERDSNTPARLDDILTTKN